MPIRPTLRTHRAIALSAVMGLGIATAPVLAAPGAVAPAFAQDVGADPLAEQTIQPGVAGLDPSVDITEAPAPQPLPTEPNFQYFSTPRDLTGCPFTQTPPPPVDESEVPQPGQRAPEAPPIPDEPAGGEKLGGCEPVTEPDFEVPPDITASGWIVADADSRKVLAAQDPHGRYRPASIIKTLLALVVLDHLDLDKVVTLTDEDLEGAEGTLVGLGAGGEYSLRTIFSGLLLISGNDAAYALANQLGGEERTLELMREKCEEIGCTDTNPTSISGLDKPGNMTSAYDMSLMFSAALKNDVYRDIVTTERIGFPGYPAGPAAAPPNPDDPPTDEPGATDDAGNVDNGDGSMTTPDGDLVRKGFVVYNDNRLLEEYPGTIGGKTGFTDDARQTFVAGAERDGRKLVVVLMDGTSTPKTSFEQAQELLDAGFATDPGTEGVGELVGSSEDAAQAAGAHADGTPKAPGSDDSDGILATITDRVPVVAWFGIAALIAVCLLFVRAGRKR